MSCSNISEFLRPTIDEYLCFECMKFRNTKACSIKFLLHSSVSIRSTCTHILHHIQSNLRRSYKVFNQLVHPQRCIFSNYLFLTFAGETCFEVTLLQLQTLQRNESASSKLRTSGVREDSQLETEVHQPPGRRHLHDGHRHRRQGHRNFQVQRVEDPQVARRLGDAPRGREIQGEHQAVDDVALPGHPEQDHPQDVVAGDGEDGEPAEPPGHGGARVRDVGVAAGAGARRQAVQDDCDQVAHVEDEEEVQGDPDGGEEHGGAPPERGPRNGCSKA